MFNLSWWHRHNSVREGDAAMHRRVILPLVVAGTVGSALAVAGPAQAHGYVSGPPSRQALCAQHRVPDCGEIVWEPQSVEGPKGLRSCHGGNARFAVLNDDNRGWPATSVGGTVTFTWTNTARHATRDWEYFIGDTRIAVFDGGGQQPGSTVTHTATSATTPVGRRSSRYGTSPTPPTPSTPAWTSR